MLETTPPRDTDHRRSHAIPPPELADASKYTLTAYSKTNIAIVIVT